MGQVVLCVGICGDVCGGLRVQTRTSHTNERMHVEPCSSAWLGAVEVAATSDVVRAHKCKQACENVKGVSNNVFSTIRVFEYSCNRSYESGRDAEVGKGAKSEVRWRV